jgi:hypothetical protein
MNDNEEQLDETLSAIIKRISLLIKERRTGDSEALAKEWALHEWLYKI